MFLFPCDKKHGESQFSPAHRLELKEDNGEKLEQNVEQYGISEGSPVGVQWAVIVL